MNEEIVNNHQENPREEEKRKAEKTTTIIVNGVKCETQEKKLSFEEIIKLAFGQFDKDDTVAYTASYSYKKGHQNDKGILVAGDSVKVKEGMVFNATKTTRS